MNMKRYIEGFLQQNASFMQGVCDNGGVNKSDVMILASGTFKNVYGIGLVKEYEDGDPVIMGNFNGNKFILGRSPYITGKS